MDTGTGSVAHISGTLITVIRTGPAVGCVVGHTHSRGTGIRVGAVGIGRTSTRGAVGGIGMDTGTGPVTDIRGTLITVVATDCAVGRVA